MALPRRAFAQSFPDVPPLWPGIVGISQIKSARPVARRSNPFNDAVSPTGGSGCGYGAHELGRGGFSFRSCCNRLGAWTHRYTFLLALSRGNTSPRESVVARRDKEY